MRKLRALTVISMSAVVLMSAAACSGVGAPPPKARTDSSASTATSAAAFGGMDKLVAAAKKEGQLNVIALPPDWANYGTMISTFEKKYGITINSAQPDGNSQDEINAATQLKGSSRAPDTFDLGINVAIANLKLFAPYKVSEWSQIPSGQKDANGAHVSGYTGYMSIGYNASKVPAPTTVNDLLKPEYKGLIALNGDPTTASAAFHGVVMAALANGGSADDIAPGVEFFKKLHESGNLLPVNPSPATIASGQTPLVIDWDYLNVAQAVALKGKIDWKVVVPKDAVVGAYYQAAVNKDAPHPAAARLWQEFLFSPEGQNIWLKGFARPVLANAMVKNGTIDKAAYAALPAAPGKATVLTLDQLTKGQDYLKTNWQSAVG